MACCTSNSGLYFSFSLSPFQDFYVVDLPPIEGVLADQKPDMLSVMLNFQHLGIVLEEDGHSGRFPVPADVFAAPLGSGWWVGGVDYFNDFHLNLLSLDW
jgi:hypothetical protein